MNDVRNETPEKGWAGEISEIPEKTKNWLDDMARENADSITDAAENPEKKDETDIAGNPERKADAAENTENEEEDDIAELLEKIYDCEEEDFSFEDFDFEDEKLEKILKYFRPEIWNKLDLGDKKRVIMGFEGYLIDKLNIQKVPSIDYWRGPLSMCGGYNPDSNEIRMNLNLMNDGKETLNTLAHEMRHAYQHERAEKLETAQDKLYQLNFDNYIRPENIDGKYVNFDIYEGQLVEAEARAFADKFEERIGAKS